MFLSQQCQPILTYLQGQTKGVDSAEMSDVSQFFSEMFVPSNFLQKVPLSVHVCVFVLLSRDFKEMDSNLTKKLCRV